MSRPGYLNDFKSDLNTLRKSFRSFSGEMQKSLRIEKITVFHTQKERGKAAETAICNTQLKTSKRNNIQAFANKEKDTKQNHLIEATNKQQNRNDW